MWRLDGNEHLVYTELMGIDRVLLHLFHGLFGIPDHQVSDDLDVVFLENHDCFLHRGGGYPFFQPLQAFLIWALDTNRDPLHADLGQRLDQFDDPGYPVSILHEISIPNVNRQMWILRVQLLQFFNDVLGRSPAPSPVHGAIGAERARSVTST